jgi:hypothetical protein
MGRTAFWDGERLKDLLSLSIEELQEKYPGRSRQNVISSKRYWSIKMEQYPSGDKSPEELEKLAKAFSDAGLPFTPEDLSQADRAGFHVGYIRNADGEIEYTKPLPHVDFGSRNKRGLPVNLEPVVPAVIKMNRARIPRRDHKVIFVISDAQVGYRRINDSLVPIHDEAAISAALKLANDLRPDYVVDCGDTVDLAELTRFQQKDNHFQATLQPSLQRTHDMFAEFTAATPGAERHSVDSNHTARLGKYILSNAFELFNVTAPGDKYPALSIPGLLKLDQIGWEFHGGYGLAEYEYAPDLAFIHGTDSVSQGSTAAKLGKKNWDRNIVQGHAHRMETQYHTDRHGQMFGAFVVGALCRRDGYVPSYWSSVDQFNQPVRKNENWQNAIMVIRDYGEGRYQFDHVPIWDGQVFYNGKSYKGDER